jgi:hypothetical protein
LEAETAYAERYYKHLDRMNGITANKFIWQDRASEVTLWLVAFVVISGVCLAALQLWLAFFRGGEITDTTLEVSASNFRVTSSVVGIIILTISVAFLYLFLKEIYRIELIDLSSPGQPITRGQDANTSEDLTPSDFGLPPPSSSKVQAPRDNIPQGSLAD